MSNTLSRKWRAGLCAGAFVCCATLAAHAQSAPPAVTPVPAVTGPIPVTASSYPLLSAARQIYPTDLRAAGYLEEEFFMSGTANVYDWPAPGELTVRTAGAPYTTRVLLRRPADPARFSGNVIVEILHAPRGHDWALMWGYSHAHMLEQGDAWAGITMTPDAARALERFNPARYPSLSFTNPNPAEACGNDRETSDSEEGLRWDMISQLGALLKSTVPSRPLAGFSVERVYMTAQDNAQLTYINAIHPHARLADGAPVYDGYVVKSGRNAGRIRRCAAAPPAGDPRHAIRNVDVPVINLQMEGDVPRALSARRPDSDEPGDRFRLYEIAGTAHIDSAVYRWGTPSIEDMKAAGRDVTGYTVDWPFDNGARCEPEIPLTVQPILGYITNGAFASLDRWVRTGTPPPRADRIQVTGTGRDARLVKDRFGNGVGGVRTPHVEVPTATYHTNHKGALGTCRNFGYSEPFTWQRLETLYGSHGEYAANVTQSVDRFVRERWLTASDGQRVKAELLGVAPGGTR